jgi:hypothetical protein
VFLSFWERKLQARFASQILMFLRRFVKFKKVYNFFRQLSAKILAPPEALHFVPLSWGKGVGDREVY